MSNLEKTTTQPKKRGRKPKPKDPNEPPKQPKRRGRKPKVKDSNTPKKVPKKRGRKPKVKDPNEPPKIPKKRGRKPKQSVYSVKKEPLINHENVKVDTLILHLPIHSKDLKDDLLETRLLRYNELTEPEPFESEINYELLKKGNVPNMVTKPQIDFVSSTNLDSGKLTESFKESSKKSDERTKYYDQIDNNILTFQENKLVNIRYEFINANEKKEWPRKIKGCCLWCCHPFDWIPVALPERYYREKFYVKDFFCSWNCAASHNFSKKDSGVWERYSLLNLMYKKLNECNFVKISKAPSREVLKMFLGYLTIEEFRRNLITQDKLFNVLEPPIVSLIPKVEELYNSKKGMKNKKKYIPMDKNILEKAKKSEQLRLERGKPLINETYTLSKFMDMKII